MRRIAIFGATGSIGQNTLDLVRRGADAFRVVALTGGANVGQLARDAVEFGAEIAVTAFEDRYGELREALSGTGVEAAAGPAAVVEAADRPADWAMSAIVGVAGLAPGLRALRQGATLALANKESLVAAGPLLLEEARERGATILPVDSEHSGVFQALRGEDPAAVERVVITASGGAFRDWPVERLADVTPEEAATHPVWDMGQRITIDSASMFNKALEMIEAREFFGLRPDQVEVLVHPEGLVHAMVGFRDGAMMTHVGPADMRHAIGYALHEGERRDLPVDRLDLAEVGRLTFRPADEDRWPALRLARGAMERGGLAGAAFNASKERALDGFLAREIGFQQMAEVVEAATERAEREIGPAPARMTLDAVLEADRLARRCAADAIAAAAGG